MFSRIPFLVWFLVRTAHREICMRDGWAKQSGNQCFRKVLLVLTQIIADLEAHLLDGGSSHTHTPSSHFKFSKSKARQVWSSLAMCTSFWQGTTDQGLATVRDSSGFQFVLLGSRLLSSTSHPAFLAYCLPTTDGATVFPRLLYHLPVRVLG